MTGKGCAVLSAAELFYHELLLPIGTYVIGTAAVNQASTMLQFCTWARAGQLESAAALEAQLVQQQQQWQVEQLQSFAVQHKTSLPLICLQVRGARHSGRPERTAAGEGMAAGEGSSPGDTASAAAAAG